MRGIKIFLAVVTFMLIVALGFGVYVWFKLQTLQASVVKSDESIQIVSNDELPAGTGTNATETGETTAEIGDVVIEGDQITDSQKKVLETFGFETDQIVITEKTISCAEEELGVERIAEIIDGATPGPLESFKLLGCI